MFYKNGKTSKSYASQIVKNDYVCAQCKKIMKNIFNKPSECSFCKSKDIDILIPENTIKRDEDATVTN